MDSFLPQMETFDFDRLDPIALEQTLAYLKAHPEPEDFQALMDDAVAERDWLVDEGMQDIGMEVGMEGGQLSVKTLAASNQPEHRDLPCGLNFIGERLDNTFPPSKDIFSRLASTTLGLQTLHLSDFMASELPSDLNNVQTGYNTYGVPSLLAQKELGRQQAFAKSLVPEQTNVKSRNNLRCTWDGCEVLVSSLGDLTNHLTEHSIESFARWTSYSSCVWQGCKSKAIFKTPNLYSEHLKNIHSHPLVCNALRCTCKKPFRNRADLDRHNRTVHLKEQKWECPYDSCEAEARTFARKDKWLKHIREIQHQNDAFCPFFHCSTTDRKYNTEFLNREEISKHFASCHSGDPESRYECALGSCGGDLKRDFWSVDRLGYHLLIDHGFHISRWRLEDLLNKDRVFGMQHIHLQQTNELVPVKFHDCKTCPPHSQGLSWVVGI